ncbi:nucleoside triphosphate pyrophosphohydrolase [candidate division KSB1 bacterium]|nr:nucleoside triphosphate pyrophosphohydrolase [candidate division KSB1 bacterium]
MNNLEKIKDQFAKLVEIMAGLRGEQGCPWDKEQTHESLRQYLLEETYEVLELIDEARYDELKNELGDLLLQVIFQSQIAKEEGRFDIRDVVENINKKLIHRHPNVFGDTVIKTAEEQTVNWEKMKKKEDSDRSVIDGVPKQLPSLLRAHRIQQKAATVGFDWDNTLPVFEKVEEEFNELKQAIKNKNSKNIEEEFGDLLFTMVNLSRFIQVNPEDSLRLSVEKFACRFKKMEEKVKQNKQTFEEMSLNEMDEIWDEIKDDLKK